MNAEVPAMGKVTIKTLPDKAAWRENRKLYIGGSDAAAVLGRNQYMSNVALWEIKTGKKEQEDVSEKDVVKFGTEAEEHIRGLFELMYPQYAVGYEANNSFHNSDYPWAAASLDGVLVEKAGGRLGILEVKTANIMTATQKENWKDRIPDAYYCQLLHYFMVTEFDYADLIALLRYDYYDDAEIKHFHIERSDVEADIRFLTDREREFWDDVIHDRKPALILPSI